MPGLRTVAATRYVTPLREGGSLPGLVEADDDGLYVLKFRGAGQGIKALVAEVIAGELARALGLAVPEIVLMEVDPALGAAEPDPEIQELITGSAGLNVALDFLPGSLPYTPAAGFQPTPELAAEVVWLDALVTNVDRTPRNPNLLVWHERLWLIDHGAALYFHHRDWDPEADAPKPFAGDRRPRAAADRRLDRRGGRAARGAPDADARARGGRARCPPSWIDAERYVRVPHAPPARAPRGGGCREQPVPVRDRARRPARRARRVHERRRRLLLPPAALPRGADRARRGAAGGVRARARRSPRCARTSTRWRGSPAGDADSGPVAQLEQSERFHWLVAPSSTVIQTSPVHTGLCEDPEATLARLLEKLVG